MNKIFWKIYKVVKLCTAFISVTTIIPCNISQVYASSLSNYEIDKSPLDISAESNGVKITLKEADYDGKFINISYEVTTDRDLGEFISVGGFDSGIKTTIYNDNKEYFVIGSSGGSGTRKSGENKYTGNYHKTIGNIYLDDEKVDYKIDTNTIYAQLSIEQISYTDVKTDKRLFIKGEWNFPSIELKSLGRNIYNINKMFEKEKVKLDIKNLEISPIQFSIVYIKDIENTQYSSSQWNTDISFSIKDDLGNVYESTGGGGELFYDLGVFISHCEFKNINKNANKINIYPEICSWRNLGDNILNDKGESIPNVERKYITFDSIEINLLD